MCHQGVNNTTQITYSLKPRYGECAEALLFHFFFFGSFHTIVLLSLISIRTVKHNNAFFINLLFY